MGKLSLNELLESELCETNLSLPKMRDITKPNRSKTKIQSMPKMRLLKNKKTKKRIKRVSLGV